jgi:hypothetical protein
MGTLNDLPRPIGKMVKIKRMLIYLLKEGSACIVKRI